MLNEQHKLAHTANSWRCNSSFSCRPSQSPCCSSRRRRVWVKWIKIERSNILLVVITVEFWRRCPDTFGIRGRVWSEELIAGRQWRLLRLMRTLSEDWVSSRTRSLHCRSWWSGWRNRWSVGAEFHYLGFQSPLYATRIVTCSRASRRVAGHVGHRSWSRRSQNSSTIIMTFFEDPELLHELGFDDNDNIVCEDSDTEVDRSGASC